MEHLTEKRVKQMGKERLVDTEAVTRDLLTIKASDAICRYITSHGLSAGDRIPSERELARNAERGPQHAPGSPEHSGKRKDRGKVSGQGNLCGQRKRARIIWT